MTEQEPEAPFRFVVDGSRKLEDVPLREIAAMLEGFATLVARGSADILNRPMHPGAGRQEGPIEEAVAAEVGQPALVVRERDGKRPVVGR